MLLVCFLKSFFLVFMMLDNFDIEVIEADSILEPFEKSRLEESCILVEGDDEIDYVSQESKKFKSSYKVSLSNPYYFYYLLIANTCLN